MKIKRYQFNPILPRFSGWISSNRQFYALALAGVLSATTAWAFEAPLIGDTTLTIGGRNSATAGAMATLSVDGSHASLLQFDLGMLPAGTTANEIYAATLKVFVNRVTAAGSIRLLAINGAWSETQVPIVTLTPLPGAATIPISAKNSYVCFDVTALVKNWIGGAANNGIAIGADPGGAGVKIALDSKENIATGHSATLCLDLGGSGSTGINGSLIQSGTISANQIAPGAVGASQIAPDAVGTSQIGDGTVTSAKMAASVITALVPPGVIEAFAGPTNSIPPGWLNCDGSEVSRATYSALFSAISIAWGTGNGVSTFNLPDLRGWFLRGVDQGVGNDPDADYRWGNGNTSGDAIGTYQGHDFQSHQHIVPWGESSVNYTPPWGFDLNDPMDREFGAQYSDWNNTWYMSSWAQGDMGNETRPMNAYVLYIIKY